MSEKFGKKHPLEWGLLVVAVTLVVASCLGGCASVGEYVSGTTGTTPRARYAAWGDYYATLPDQPAEDVAAIREAQGVLRGLPGPEGEGAPAE